VLEFKWLSLPELPPWCTHLEFLIVVALLIAAIGLFTNRIRKLEQAVADHIECTQNVQYTYLEIIKDATNERNRKAATHQLAVPDDTRLEH
jgi:hypothetical protein